jgi:glycine cleavage system H protein
MTEGADVIPEQLRYTSEHEWVAAADGRARVGITHYAQDALGDVVFVQLPEVGAEITAGEAVGEIESTKSVSELYAPVTGTVAAVNQAVADAPEVINSDPYGQGWLFEVAPTDPATIAELLDADGYRQLTQG